MASTTMTTSSTDTSAGGTFRAMRFTHKNSSLTMQTLPIPTPSRHQVRIKIMAAGVCATDHFTQHNTMEISYPKTPGHEIAGYIDAVGDEVKDFKVGDRVGVGWTAYHCDRCNCCLSGDTACCENVEVSGNTVDGGYGEYMLCHQKGLARIPDQLSYIDAAPLMDAGLTIFGALRNSVARAHDLVAIVGIGGLGHLGIQYANKMGFRVAAVSRGTDKKADCFRLGAHYFFDEDSMDVGAELTKLGGAKCIVVTATTNSSTLFEQLAMGLHSRGEIMLLTTLTEPPPVKVMSMILKRGSITAWNTGDAREIEDTMQFSVMHNIKPIVEKYSLEDAPTAYKRCQDSDTKYRGVIVMPQAQRLGGVGGQ